MPKVVLITRQILCFSYIHIYGFHLSATPTTATVDNGISRLPPALHRIIPHRPVRQTLCYALPIFDRNDDSCCALYLAMHTVPSGDFEYSTRHRLCVLVVRCFIASCVICVSTRITDSRSRQTDDNTILPIR